MTKQGRVIGKDNSLPWDIPEEMKLFRSYTKDSTVILGRKTFESVGSKPLPNRNNIIVSTSLPEQEGVDVCRNIKNSIEKAKSYNKEIYILGGATIYEQSFQFANKMYLSFIKKEYEGNTIFPKWSDDEWKIVSKEDHEEFEFVIFNKK